MTIRFRYNFENTTYDIIHTNSQDVINRTNEGKFLLIRETETIAAKRNQGIISSGTHNNAITIIQIGGLVKNIKQHKNAPYSVHAS